MLEQFSRTNSVRDRMRKFTEATQSSSVPAVKRAPLRNGTTTSSRAAELLAHASLSTSGDRPARPHADAATPQPRGGASKPLSLAGQWQSSVGGTRHPAEKDVHASSDSKEGKTPGRAAAQQVTQGEEDPDMKTFLTIEIKDGRTTSSSSTAPPRGNMVPISSMTPRINTSGLGQRAGRSSRLTS